MRVRKTVENPDTQFVAMPQTITPAGIELNPTTEPIEESDKDLDVKEIILDKIKINGQKYPVSKSKGIATKYDDL